MTIGENQDHFNFPDMSQISVMVMGCQELMNASLNLSPNCLAEKFLSFPSYMYIKMASRDFPYILSAKRPHNYPGPSCSKLG